MSDYTYVTIRVRPRDTERAADSGRALVITDRDGYATLDLFDAATP